MEVKFNCALIDIWRFQFYTLSRRRSIAIINIIAMVLIYKSIWKAIGNSGDSHVGNVIISILMLLIVMGVLTIIMMIIIMLSFIPKLNKGILGDHRIILSPTGIIEETKYGKTETNWNGVIKVVQRRKYIFIYLSEHSAHVIPKRAFKNKNEINTFFEEIHKFYKKAA